MYSFIWKFLTVRAHSGKYYRVWNRWTVQFFKINCYIHRLFYVRIAFSRDFHPVFRFRINEALASWRISGFLWRRKCRFIDVLALSSMILRWIRVQKLKTKNAINYQDLYILWKMKPIRRNLLKNNSNSRYVILA